MTAFGPKIVECWDDETDTEFHEYRQRTAGDLFVELARPATEISNDDWERYLVSKGWEKATKPFIRCFWTQPEGYTERFFFELLDLPHLWDNKRNIIEGMISLCDVEGRGPQEIIADVIKLASLSDPHNP